ncbi:MAG: XdhC family protein [Abditibacteriales bacterium]|nr:XdhC family protein [Abditibacteriales bacterium]MDW8365866.1 XdhC family protein [Abditibacteriales bacterium]
MMKDIYTEAVELTEKEQPFALATVVYTSGSTPQKPGAKAIFLPHGEIRGTIGGGCLEAESRLRALDAIRSGRRLLFDLHLDDDFGWDDGLICGGTAKIFIDPHADQSAPLLRQLAQAVESKQRVALATVVDAPDPDLVGARALVQTDGSMTGHLMEPALRDAIAARVSALFEKATEKPELFYFPIHRDGNGHDAGRKTQYAVYLEIFLPRPTLLIAGAGHIGATLARLAAQCDFDVTLVDDRPDLCNPQRVPEAHCVCADIVETCRHFPVTPDTFIVIVTRGHRHDAQVLREVIHTPARYIGMIGSRRKITLIYKEMVEEGIATEADLQRVHSPIGLHIGSLLVPEIAVSILAELIAIRRGVPPESMGKPMSFTAELLLREQAKVR